MSKQRSAKTKQKAAATIKGGYLPVRVRILGTEQRNVAEGNNNSGYDMFMFVKEHSTSTIFVTNAVRMPQIMRMNSTRSSSSANDDKELLRLVFRKFGPVDKIVLAADPKQMRPTNTNDDENMTASSIFEADGIKNFAHVTFSSSKGLKRVMSCAEEGVVLQQEELDALLLSSGINTDHDDNANSIKESNELSGVPAIAARYRARIPPLEELSARCDEIMASFEATEESERLAMEASAQPDADGFITVTKESNLVAFRTGKRGHDDGDDNGEDGGKSRGKSRKRSRKRREPRGSVELKDFYKFQMRESKRKGVEDLRKRFEEDLQTVKKMKEQKQFKPFAN